MSALKEKLDTVERGEWRKQKAIIAKGREDFWTFMRAIKIVRDKRLYREDYKTFETFVETECGIGKRYANYMIEASDVKEDLGTIVPKNAAAKTINRESQLRELVDVPRDELEAVVEKAAEIAGDQPITAKVIKQAKEAVLEYEDVDERQPGEDDEPLPDEFPAKISKLKSAIKQHNAAMMRLVDELQTLAPDRDLHRGVHIFFRGIDKAMGDWK